MSQKVVCKRDYRGQLSLLLPGYDDVISKNYYGTYSQLDFSQVRPQCFGEDL